MYALGRFGPAAVESVDTLIGIINDPISVEYIRNEKANPQTPDKYKPDSAYVHGEAEAARALGKIAPGTPMADKAVTTLLAVLNSDASFCRTAAIEALARFGPKAASAIPRIRALTEDKDKEVRDAAGQALPLIGGEGEPASRPR